MANLKEVKTRISSVMSTQQITKAMKMVAAAKLRRAQDNIIQMRPYAHKLGEILQNVSAGLETEDNVYSTKRDIENVLIISISSDRGLCGPFNSNIFKATTALIDRDYRQQYEAGNVTVLPLGKRSRDFFKKRNYNVTNDYYEIFGDLSFENVRKIAEVVMASFIQGKYDRVDIVYNEFKNVATQIICREQYLPIAEAVRADDEVGATENDYIYQPSQEVIVEEMIPKSLKVQLFKALLESNASEHGARMTAMDKATENAGDLLKELRLKYNQTRQAAITKEILEIVGGADALV
jgi:F-type H+-transporting ATPase subunit gamma